MVKDPSDPNAIRLDHSAFKHPRESWDKILASPHFANVNKTDLFKLMICFPNKNWQQDQDLDEMLSQTEKELKDLRLDAHLPKFEYLDLKARKRNGHAEFIVLTRYEVETVMAFEYHTHGTRESQVDIKVKSEGLARRTVYVLHMRPDTTRKILSIVKTISFDEPIALSTSTDRDENKVCQTSSLKDLVAN